MPNIDRLLGAVPPGGVTTDVVGRRMRHAMFGGDETAPPPSLGRYDVLERIGAGGMGTVWAAWDRKLDRRVALKVLRPELGGGTARAHARLLREAQALARLSDPHVVAVFDVVTWRPDDDGPEYIVLAMEHVAGMTLREWLDERPRSVADIVGMFVQAGRGIAAAHAAGVVHRDFKPANVIVAEDGRPRVVDFGLADRLPTVEEESASSKGERGWRRDGRGADTSNPAPPTPDPGAELPDDASVATTRAMRPTEGRSLAGAGTPRYMAPEQHLRGTVDGRSDQYAFCVALWEALHGTPPFRADNVFALAEAKRGTPHPGDRRIARWLRRALVRGLAPDPARRFEDMPALLSALSRDPTRRRIAVAVGAAVVGGAVIGVLAWPQEPGCDSSAALTGIWDAPRATAVEAAFAATGLPYAADSWQTARGNLDAWAEEWRLGRIDACEDHRTGEQSDDLFDRRMSCLDDRRRRLDALLDILAKPDAEVVARAVQAVQRLPEVERCADVLALREVASLPEDPQQAALVTDLRGRLAVARAATDAGRHAEGLERADAVLADYSAWHVEHPVTLADGSLARAEALGFLQRGEDAHEEFVRAARAAQQAGADELFAYAATGLVWELDGLRDFRGAEDWAALAEGALARIGGQPDVAYRLGNAIATLELDRGDSEAAAARLTNQLEVVTRRFGPGDYRAFVLGTNLGNVYLASGRLDDAEAAYGHAIQIGRAALGPTHPRVLMARNNRVSALNRAARTEEAWAEVDRVVAALRAGLGDAHPDTAASLVTRSVLAGNLGRMEDAETDARAALAVLGPETETSATAWMSLARAQSGTGNFEAARTSADDALRIVRAIREGKPSVEEAHILEVLGEIDADAGDLVAAEGRFWAMFDTLEAASGDDLRRSAALHQLAEVVRRSGRGLEALSLAIGARALVVAAAGTEHPAIADIDATMAEILLDLGRYDDATARLEIAATLHDRISSPAMRRVPVQRATERARAMREPGRG
jgi:serine/threonine protein kinase/tetratricopeptide (TPR) repeat protein